MIVELASSIANDRILLEQVSIVTNSEGVTFQDRKDPRRSVTVSEDHLLDLMSFMSALNPDVAERRASYRYTLWRSCGLTASLTLHNREWSVTPLDLSLVGILIRIPKNMPEMWLGSEMNVTLTHGPDITSLRGIVRRRNEDEYGVQFPSSNGEDGHLNPPEPLRKILMKVERGYLMRRVKPR